jgi:hypothetical protein
MQEYKNRDYLTEQSVPGKMFNNAAIASTFSLVRVEPSSVVAPTQKPFISDCVISAPSPKLSHIKHSFESSSSFEQENAKSRVVRSISLFIIIILIKDII